MFLFALVISITFSLFSNSISFAYFSVDFSFFNALKTIFTFKNYMYFYV